MGFTENLNRIMKEKKLKVPALSKLSGITVRTLTSYTQGTRKAPQDKLEALALALHVTTDELIGLPAAPKAGKNKKASPGRSALEGITPEMFCSQFTEGSLTHETLADGSIRLHSTLAIRTGDVIIDGSEFSRIVKEAKEKAASLCKQIEAAIVMETAAVTAEVKVGQLTESDKQEQIDAILTAAGAAVFYSIVHMGKDLSQIRRDIRTFLKPIIQERQAMAKLLRPDKYKPGTADGQESTLDRMSREAWFASPGQSIEAQIVKIKKLEAQLFASETEKHALQAAMDRVLRQYEPGHNSKQYADYKALLDMIRDEFHRELEAIRKDYEARVRESIKAGFKLKAVRGIDVDELQPDEKEAAERSMKEIKDAFVKTIGG